MNDTDANTPGPVPMGQRFTLHRQGLGDMRGTLCHNCEQPASDRHGLPVAEDGQTYVAVDDSTTAWVAVPSCEPCNQLYVAAGDRCNEVLAAYTLASQRLRHELDIAREFVRRLARLADEAASATRAER